MLKLEENLETIGLICHVDKKGQFWCKPPEGGKLKIQYSDKNNALMIQYDDDAVIITGVKDIIGVDEVRKYAREI